MNIEEILPKKAHQRLGRMLGDRLKDVEHFRIRDENRHVAVVCLVDGSCWWGESVCSPKDTYSRALGHTIAVGRALKNAVVYNHIAYADFVVDEGVEKKDLRDAVRWKLIEGGIIPEYLAHYRKEVLSTAAAGIVYFPNKDFWYPANEDSNGAN